MYEISSRYLPVWVREHGRVREGVDVEGSRRGSPGGKVSDAGSVASVHGCCVTICDQTRRVEWAVFLARVEDPVEAR